MRNDLDSLNPGKAVAQGGHAVSKFCKAMYTTNHKFKREFKKWEGGYGFGTKVTLSADFEQINDILGRNQDEYPMDIVLDPTYPLQDGKVTHHIPLHTCAYVFAPARWHGVAHLKRMK